MLQFFQRHEINKMHKTPIVSLVFTFLFSLFFTWAAFASLHLHLPIRLWRRAKRQSRHRRMGSKGEGGSLASL
jgi:uncharacterized BrkB/YihY/UPF0761 family membrane protein